MSLYCENCGSKFEQDVKGCPNCGSDKVWFELTTGQRIWTGACIIVGAASIIGAIVYIVLNQ